jgi:hypothetical protein
MGKSTELILPADKIESRIFNIRGLQVMLDRDLAELYGVEVKRLNEQVKRNFERFPENFRFQLSDNEFYELVAICDRFETLKHSSTNPHAFTEAGVAMLSAVLRSPVAVKVSVQIINAFVAMRKMLLMQIGITQRLEAVEQKQIETDKKIDKVFDALANKETFTLSHDRFLIIDNKEVYHLGASLKDLGKKWFAFSKMEPEGLVLMEKIRQMA